MVHVDSGSTVRHLQSVESSLVPLGSITETLIPVVEPLKPLFPYGGIRRGSIITVLGDPLSRSPNSSVAFGLASAASQQGSWVGVVNAPHLSFAAAKELGIELRRVAAVSIPHEQWWGAALGTLVDIAEVVILGAPPATQGDFRRLRSLLRESKTVALTLGWRWPEGPDVTLRAETIEWFGLGKGHGHLTSRVVRIATSGRREADYERRVDVWLPSPKGGIQAVESASLRLVGKADKEASK